MVYPAFKNQGSFPVYFVWYVYVLFNNININDFKVTNLLTFK